MGEENKQQEITKKRLFAETSVTENAHVYAMRTATYSAEDVIEMLENPYDNALELQRVSLWLYHSSGIYNRIINNYAGMNEYDLYLYPTTISRFVKSGKKKTANEKLFKEYMDIANVFEKYSYKSNFRNIGVNLLVQGEVFLYRVEDNSGVIEKEMPSDMCKICRVINDGLYKYAINMSKLGTENLRLMMPKPIQDLYEKYKAGTLPPEQYMSNNYVIVDDIEAICLSLNNTLKTKSVPPLSYLFPSLIRLMEEETEEIQENKINNLKMIHMKYELDEEGEPIIDEAELRKMHLQAKANLPAGVCINTNPLNVTALTLQRTGNVSASNRATLTELVYNNAGVNSEIFNGNQSNNQAIITGVTADEIYCDTLNSLFENYSKYMIKAKKKNALWMVRFIRNTKFNKSNCVSEAMQCCTVGLSRLKLLATQHYSPIEGLAILDFETSSSIDDLFVPMATSYTQSGDDAEAGRTKNKDDENNEKNVGENKDSTNE